MIVMDDIKLCYYEHFSFNLLDFCNKWEVGMSQFLIIIY